MANKTKSTRKRKQFLAVDVWRAKFGPVSETAVYDVFQQKFNIDSNKMNDYKFTECVEALRKLEDPDYETGDLALTNPNKLNVEYEHIVVEQEQENKQ